MICTSATSRRRFVLAPSTHVRDDRLDVGGLRLSVGLTMKFACFSDTRAPPTA
jgi:hypothetical protein